MTTLFGPLLATALIAQLQGGTLQGTVVDDQGKPVADAQTVFFAPPPRASNVEPVEVRTKTDAQGRFRLATPPLAREAMNGVHVWAYRPGSAITATASNRPPLNLVLHKPEPRTVTIEGPDGQPLSGARVSPRVVFGAAWATPADMPETMAAPLAVTTGPDGKAILTYLRASDQLVAVRVAADSIGTQDLQLIDRPFGRGQMATITIRLKPTSRLAGRVRTRAGEPVSGQTIEVWCKGGTWLEPSPVGFKNGSLRTVADGSFETPDNLLVGSSYRVVVRAPGKEPILSEWITIGEQPGVLLPMIQRPLRTIVGRVVDRQRKPVAGVEVFQTGDGPERTATNTSADGRFSLGGFQHGSVFLFARGEGFRFHGQLIKPADLDVTLELTRIGERPAREMKMLPDPIPLEESRAMARRLLEPCWKAVAEHGQDAARYFILDSLVPADPAGVLEKLETVNFNVEKPRLRLLRKVVLALSQRDGEEAAAVAESIADPGTRSWALVHLADTLPPEQRERKLALLDRAVHQARIATDHADRLLQMGDVAERWYELNEVEKAKSLFAEGLVIAKQFSDRTDFNRGLFAARLARVDLSSALAIAEQLPANGIYSASWALRDIALRLAAENPPAAEQVMRQVPQVKGRYWLPQGVVWKMASVDPVRARRLVEESQRYFDHPQMYLFLALGLKSRDVAAAQQAFQTAMQGIDRLMEEGVEYAAMQGLRGVLLPLVEQIDPALVPEVFWRAVATRLPVGDPRSDRDFTLSRLFVLLAWYDRDVAAALFEPVRAQMEFTSDLELGRWSIEFLGWSIFDPRAAVARLERMPIPAQLDLSSKIARERVSESLGLSHEARWRNFWDMYTEMSDLVERDFR